MTETMKKPASNRRSGKTTADFIAQPTLPLKPNTILFSFEQPTVNSGTLDNWVITRFGHASRGNTDTRINDELRKSHSRNRINRIPRYCNLP